MNNNEENQTDREIIERLTLTNHLVKAYWDRYRLNYC